MIARRRILLLVVAVGLIGGSFLVGPASPVSAQDPTVTTTDPNETNQLLLEGEPQAEQRILTENRRVLAVIGGLVIVALALALLTVRYWRKTKPIAVPAPAEIVDDGSGDDADHQSAGEDWEPRGTGEHVAVAATTVPRATRPGVEARRRALERSAAG